MFVVTATLSNLTPRTRNSVCRPHLSLLALVNMLFSGKRPSKNVSGGLAEKIKMLSDVFVKRRKALLDQATTMDIEITAFQIMHQDRPR